MKNKLLFQRDPAVSKLLNDGVAAVREATSAKELETLRYELEHFVCEGQYEDGMIRILESYLGNVGSTTQPAAWVSGFYGSGKSHLLKMFRHLWMDTKFEDGSTARGLARLPQEVQDHLRELDTLSKRCGGLHAASGTLPSGGGESVRLAVLSIVLVRAVTAMRDHLDVSEVLHAMRVSIWDPDGHVRILAAEALARQGFCPDEALPVLITVLEVGDKADIAQIPNSKQWRRVAAGVIQHYGPQAEPAIQSLRNALLDPDDNVRGYAAISLGAIGSAAIVALQDLRAARQTEANEGVREQVYDRAIRQIVGSDNFIVIRRDEDDTSSDAGSDRLRG